MEYSIERDGEKIKLTEEEVINIYHLMHTNLEDVVNILKANENN